MANVVSTRMLVLTSVEDNNNKFWEAILYDNQDVVCNWGRVGTTGQTKTFPSAGQKYIDSKIREKEKKGYKEMQVVGAKTTNKNVTVAVQTGELKSVAKKQIKYSSPIVGQLIEYLVKVNKHDIVTQSGGKLTVDTDTGLIKTDVGVAVTLDTLDRARDHLVALSKCVAKSDQSSKDFISNLNEYLMCVPQKVGSRRGWEKDFIRGDQDIQRQGALIDSMEATLKALASAPPSTNGDPTPQEQKVFDVKLDLVEDKGEFGRIEKLYRSTQKSMHASSSLRVKTVYTVQISTMKSMFDAVGAKMSNVWELWHGTRAANLLSILKSGLIIPSSSAAHVTGRMFGDGVYFSDQSTKSLNYSYGYWDGGARDNNCFMFLADVAMGKYYTPNRTLQRIPAGYDSCFAKAGESSVANNEMIVYSLDRCNLTRLVEFAP